MPRDSSGPFRPTNRRRVTKFNACGVILVKPVGSGRGLRRTVCQLSVPGHGLADSVAANWLNGPPRGWFWLAWTRVLCKSHYVTDSASRRCCASGGTGRRAGLRILWGNPWRFDSSLAHHFSVGIFGVARRRGFASIRRSSTTGASVAQSGRASPCQGECRGFESLRSLQVVSADTPRVRFGYMRSDSLESSTSMWRGAGWTE